MKLILLVGPPCSGKTTYCKDYLCSTPRISQDEMGKAGHMAELNRLVQAKAPTIVIDRMNFDAIQRKRYIDVVKDKGYAVHCIVFLPQKEILLKRAELRENHPTLTKEKFPEVLEFFYKNYQEPSLEEGISTIEVEG